MSDTHENFVSFGEEGALLTYGSYLRLADLLDAQHLESDPPAHDVHPRVDAHGPPRRRDPGGQAPTFAA